MSSSPMKVEPAGKAQEPSMEEILASIRKIISDDDSKPPEKAAEPDAAQGQDDIDALLAGFDAAADTSDFDVEPEEEPEPVLELTEDMVAGEDETVDADLDFVDVKARPEPEPEPPVSMLPEPPPPMPSQPRILQAERFEERLISTATDSAISTAFGSLTHTILSQNARTLDDLVQDMLRPMLKSWLDDNLPSLVERLVRAEIERVSRGGR